MSTLQERSLSFAIRHPRVSLAFVVVVAVGVTLILLFQMEQPAVVYEEF